MIFLLAGDYETPWGACLLPIFLCSRQRPVPGFANQEKGKMPWKKRMIMIETCLLGVFQAGNKDDFNRF
jgi:hypothetical protein